MRVRRAFLAAPVLVGVAACGSASAAAFQQPAGSLSPAPVQAPLPGQGGQRLAGCRFASDFTTPARDDRARSAVLDGDKAYVLALWAAVLSDGKLAAAGLLAAGVLAALERRRRRLARRRPPGHRLVTAPPDAAQAGAGPCDAAETLMSAPPVAVAPAPDAAPSLISSAPAGVTLLGPVCVRALGDIEASMVPLATQIVVYLAAHPGGAYPNALAQAIWPQGVAEEIRDGVLAAVARWLGADGIGRPHLAADASGRLRLGAGVTVDWHVFLTLVAQAAGAAGGKSGHTREEAKLAQALSLVSGQFLAGMGPAGYPWFITEGLACEVTARVADAARRLCELRLAAGDPRGALDAVRTGLRIARHDELLWRDLLTAAHATGQENLVYATPGEVWARACPDGPPPGMAPETEALLDEVLRTWRRTLAGRPRSQRPIPSGLGTFAAGRHRSSAARERGITPVTPS